MLWRIAEHEVERNWRREEKYCILHELKWYGYTIDYDVLYTANSGTPDALEEEIGQIEGKYIRAYLPPLNTQIPLEEDWRRYKTKEIDAGKLYEMLGCYYG